ncbi:hypothetical protein ANCCAN_10616 [Ancylostoma caninum]|uniref:VWFA domain-containing protein n=1 Tax=Ancylostoma caninum TaxID=29170 RepID=A0A368GKA0_ANCCA|nr:hypothetical protein ANCCAN_10616 [Ancylostoma caninum]
MYEKLYKNFLLTFAMHKSRVSVFVFGDQRRLHYRRNVAYKMDSDFEAIVNKEIQSWKDSLRHPTGKGGSMSTAVDIALKHLTPLANNKKLLILVVAGKQYDTEKTVEILEKVRREGIQVRVFGVLNAGRDDYYKNFGDPDAFMINNVGDQFPQDVYVSFTSLAHSHSKAVIS